MKTLLTTETLTALQETYTLNTYEYEGTMYYEYMLDGNKWLYTTMPYTLQQLEDKLMNKYKAKYNTLWLAKYKAQQEAWLQLKQQEPKKAAKQAYKKPKTYTNASKSYSGMMGSDNGSSAACMQSGDY